MNNILHFGISMPISRTDLGALSSREMEKISDFLRRRGLLIAEYLDSYIVIVHPDLVKDVNMIMMTNGLRPLLVSASLFTLRQATSLTLAENRVLELLTPGPVILEKDNGAESTQLSVVIPDSFDLRDLCCIYGGTLQAYIWQGEDGRTYLEEMFTRLDLEKCGIVQLGVLEPPIYDDIAQEKVTIARIFGPGNVECIVEGVFDYKLVKDASNNISMWEIGEWT